MTCINSIVMRSVSLFVHLYFLMLSTLPSTINICATDELTSGKTKIDGSTMANPRKYKEPVTVDKFPQQKLRIIPLSVQHRLGEGAGHRQLAK